MLATMNPREKKLLIIVGVMMGVLLTHFLVKFLLGQRADYARQIAATQSKIDLLKKRETERDLWARRDAWLTEKLAPIGDPDVASKALRESILETAKKHNVIIEAPAPGVPSNQPGRTSLTLRFDAKGEWAGMFNFLIDLQGVEKFVAIENCELKVNREDKTQIRASMTVARWFAPRTPLP